MTPLEKIGYDKHANPPQRWRVVSLDRGTGACKDTKVGEIITVYRDDASNNPLFGTNDGHILVIDVQNIQLIDPLETPNPTPIPHQLKPRQRDGWHLSKGGEGLRDHPSRHIRFSPSGHLLISVPTNQGPYTAIPREDLYSVVAVILNHLEGTDES